jgi:hypothetical protein
LLKKGAVSANGGILLANLGQHYKAEISPSLCTFKKPIFGAEF